MKQWWMGLCLTIVVVLLVGCGGGNSAAAANSNSGSGNGAANGAAVGGAGNQARFQDTFQSAYLKTDYDNALPSMQQISLGTLELEGTDNAVTPEQAKKLIPLWQGLMGGAIQNQTERNAVLKQIEGTMTPVQMEGIANMQLTFQSMTEWAQQNGIEMPQGRFGQGGQGGQGGPFANMSEDERTKLREELQNMTPEQRQARLQELGIQFPQGGGQGGQGRQGGQGQGQNGQGRAGGGRFNVLMEPLVNLLTERAAE
ncbi:MAG: hypothetical protein R3C14_11585 [Caldilineaceae bacterium]